MQAIMETIFDLCYLTIVITLGIRMLRGAGAEHTVKLFGAMAVILGCGDAFHLLPRAWALWTDGLAANAAALGIGKLITSLTMTVFYLLLYRIWQERYKIKHKGLTIALYLLAALRIALCAFPQNEWLSASAPISWGIYRNLPFAAMGLLLILLYYTQAKNDPAFRFLWLAVSLSFAFYLPVVLWADVLPALGALMIPKTCAYVWIVWMGYSDWKQKRKEGAQ